MGAWGPAGQADAATCTGDPASDAALPDCGMLLAEGVTTLTWERPSSQVALVFARFADAGGLSPGHGAIEVWTQHPRSGQWQVWGPEARRGVPSFRVLEHGQTYWFVTTQEVAWSFGVPPASYLADTQVVSLYGHPGVPFMGALGRYSAADAADEAQRVAALYDEANGERGAVGALHLIVGVAQAGPGDGTYLGRMSLPAVQVYVDETRRRGMLLFLDIQVGWADPLVEVRRYESLLRLAHVHVALDPEFATRSEGVAPGQAIGSLTATEINGVQDYLAGISTAEHIPPKMLVVHQFRDDMIVAPQDIAAVEGVDLVIDMDGFGPPFQKRWGYDRYAHGAYAEYAAFKLFYDWDRPLLSVQEVLSLSPGPPDYVIYQ